MKKILTLLFCSITVALFGQSTIVGPEYFDPNFTGATAGIFTRNPTTGNTWTRVAGVPNGGNASVSKFTVGTTTLTLTNNVSTVGYTNIQVAFKEWITGTFPVSQILFQYSINGGSSWLNTGVSSSATISVPTSQNKIITLPVTTESISNLKFRFTFTGSDYSGTSTYKIDDFGIYGTVPLSIYYNVENQDLSDPESWGTNINGTGDKPVDFNPDNQTFNIINGSSSTITADWLVYGVGSKIILGNSTDPIIFSIPEGYTVYTETMDITSGATLDNGSDADLPGFETIEAGSKVIYSMSGSQNVASASYANLTLSGSGTKTLPSLTVSEVFEVLESPTISIESSTLEVTSFKGDATFASSTGALFINGTIGTPTLTFDGAHDLNSLVLNGTSSIILGSDLVLSGSLTIASGATLNANGHAITLGGTTTVNGALIGDPIFNGNSTGQFTFNSTTPSTLKLNPSFPALNRLNVLGGTLALGSNLDMDGASALITVADGATLNLGTYEVIKDTGNVDIFGKVITAHPHGLNGISPATASFIIRSTADAPSLKTTSTIEYNAGLGTQEITPYPDVNAYQNLILSGAATKHFSSGVDVSYAIKNNFTIASGTPINMDANSIVNFSGNNNQQISGTTFYTVSFSGTPSNIKTLTSPASIMTTATISGAATLASAGNLVLESTANDHAANLIMAPGASGSVTGNVVVKRYVDGRGASELTPSGFPVLLSSPVSSNLSGFQATDSNFFWYNNAATPSKWVRVGLNSPTQAGRGYFLRVKNDKVFSLTGPVNNGNITATLSNAGDQFNLLGNPYPSTIVWNTPGITMTGVNSTILVHNANANGYTPLFAGSGTRLPPLQGFFAQATVDAGTHEVVFTNASRSSVNEPLKRLEDSYTNRLTVKVSKGKNYDVAVLWALEGAQFGTYNGSQDLGKFAPNSGVPIVYFTKQEKTLSVLTFSPDEARTAVPIKFVLPSDTTYTLKFDGIDEVDPIYNIYLVDSTNNEIRSLRSLNSSYSFNATASGSAKNRFSLVFSRSIVTTLEGSAKLEDKISVFSEAGTTHITTDMLPNAVYISDVSGKRVYEATSVSSKSISLDMSAYPKGVYIASIETEGRLVHKKFILNK